MFGAWGIVIGPVLMIIIVTTISVYLAVYKGVPMATPEDDDEKPKQRKLFGWFARLTGKGKPAKVPAKPAAP
jgi:hypothetical protein